MIQAQTVGLGSIQDIVRERGGFQSVLAQKYGAEGAQQVIQSFRRPWYVQYKWPLVIGGIGVAAVVAYKLAK